MGYKGRPCLKTNPKAESKVRNHQEAIHSGRKTFCVELSPGFIDEETEVQKDQVINSVNQLRNGGS